MAKVTLDIGHGGSDPGASYKGLIEKQINLVVGMACRDELVRHGVEVQMTRTTDTYVGLSDRPRMANSWGANYFVSIHCNAGGGDRGEVIHSIYKGKGLELSNKISAELQAIGQSYVKVYERRGNDNKDYYAVIRETNMDAVIVECAFLDNEVDNKIIDTVEEQRLFGVAIAKGILKQLGIAYKPAGGDQGKVDTVYQVYSSGRWLPNVKNLSDFAGIIGSGVQGVYANLSRGSIQYRVHVKGGNWLPWVTDRRDYAGIYGKDIDGIQFSLLNLSGYDVKYKVYTNGKWLPWVTNHNDTSDGYAGIYGHSIQGLYLEVVKR